MCHRSRLCWTSISETLDDVVIYESTVYPGVTEEECLPVVERVSGLKFNVDFYAGYSPERINPGDMEHTVEKISTEYTNDITIFDPWANKDKVMHEYGVEVVNEFPDEWFDAVILGVAHKQFLGLDVKCLVKEGRVIYDVKGILDRSIVDGRL